MNSAGVGLPRSPGLSQLGILLNGVIQPFMGQVFDRTGGRKARAAVGAGAGRVLTIAVTAFTHAHPLLHLRLRRPGIYGPERAFVDQHFRAALPLVPAVAGHRNRHQLHRAVAGGPGAGASRGLPDGGYGKLAHRVDRPGHRGAALPARGDDVHPGESGPDEPAPRRR